MLIIDDLENFQATWDSCVLTLGVFDGLHRGHQALLKEVQKQSRKNKKKPARVLLSYYPHPDFVLGKRSPETSTELYTHEEKFSLLQNLDLVLDLDFGLDAVCFLRFTPELARMLAMRYLKEILLDKLRADCIIIGYDQHFGRGREGNYAFLKKMAPRYHFQVKQVKALKHRREIVSSSNIRKHIASGGIERANALLGYPFFIKAVVKRGEQRGRTLGFPTANLEVPFGKAVPLEGVYAGFVDWEGSRFRAMISIGKKPSFTASKSRDRLDSKRNIKESKNEVEAHLLDFDEKKNLYGQHITLFFQKFLRKQIKFDSAEELIAQLENDKKSLMALKIAKAGL